MRIRIKLYKLHDMDLIVLRQSYQLNMAAIGRLCLQAYVMHKDISFKLPTNSDEERLIYKKNQTSSEAKLISYDNQQFTITLKEGKDDNIIEFINSVIPGYRNMFIKQLIRISLKMPMLSQFMTDYEMQLNTFNNVSRNYALPISRTIVDLEPEPDKKRRSGIVHFTLEKETKETAAPTEHNNKLKEQINTESDLNSSTEDFTDLLLAMA